MDLQGKDPMSPTHNSLLTPEQIDEATRRANQPLQPRDKSN
jgi:hypothetical protein